MALNPSPASNVRLARCTRPARSADLLRRPRLLEQLHENIHRKLTLIAAAAGYGKTSLVVDFAQDTDYRVAWCRLDETDRDLTQIVSDVTLALRQCFPEYQSHLEQLAAEPGHGPEELARALINEFRETLDDYFILVLDDFHLVEDSTAVIRFFDGLLADLPEQAHLLIVGRTIPALRIASLAARQQMSGLSEDDLRFTPAEVQALLENRNHILMPEAEAETLVANTEGWITGILLTTHLMWRGMMASLIQARHSAGPLYEYLVEEVFDQQPEALRRFLLDSAVLPEMEPEVCDAVLERTDSAEMLRQAEARRLFVSSVGEEFRAYQYHHLFRDFLLSKLNGQDVERLKRLQSRAAGWYSAHDMPEAAVTYYVMAERFELASKVAEANARALCDTGRYATVRRWGEQLASMKPEMPELCFNLARIFEVERQFPEAKAHLNWAMEEFISRGDRRGQLRTKAAYSRHWFLQGDFSRALSEAQAVIPEAQAQGWPATAALALRYASNAERALGHLPAAEAHLRQAVELLSSTSMRFDLAAVLNELANLLRGQGQTTEAAQVQRQALAILRELASPGDLAIALNNAGYDLHLLGQYDAAHNTFIEALQWARKAGAAKNEGLILISQGDLLADLSQYAEAADLYRQALAILERASDWELTAYAYRSMARLDRWGGNLVSALEWLRRAELVSHQSQVITAGTNIQGLRGMVLFEMGHKTEGRKVLEETCARLETMGLRVDLAQTLLFRAQAEYLAGAGENSAGLLTQAFALVERMGYDQMLVSEAHSVREVLEAFRDQPDLGPRVASLLKRGQEPAATPMPYGVEGNGKVRMPIMSSSPASSAKIVTITVQALGVGRVLKDGLEISRQAWHSPRVREMFLFLVDRAPILRDTVLEVFWPRKPVTQALNNLYQMRFRLRHALGREVIVLQEQHCRLADDVRIEYDAARFETQARAALTLAPGEPKHLAGVSAALALYGGDFLIDSKMDWVLGRRQALSDLYVSLLLVHADELMSLTRYAEARKALSKALEREPFRDDVHGRMLMCLAGAGRRHEVVDHYRRYRELLRNELGLDPPQELRTLYSRLLT